MSRNLLRTSLSFWSCAILALLIGFALGHTYGRSSSAVLAGGRKTLPGRKPQPLYEYLLQYAPDRAEDIAKALDAKGLKRDEPIDPDTIPAWGEVVGEIEKALWEPRDTDQTIRDRVGWEGGKLTDDLDFRSPEINTRGIELTDSKVAVLREISHKCEAELFELEEVERVEIEQALHEEWQSGHCVKSPIIRLPPLVRPGKRVLGGRSVSIGPWHVTVSFYEGDHPAYETAAKAVDAARRARTYALRDALDRM